MSLLISLLFKDLRVLLNSIFSLTIQQMVLALPLKYTQTPTPSY